MPTDSHPPIDALRAIDAACDRFEAAWAAVATPGDGPHCEGYAAELPEGARAEGLAELFAIERACRAERGDASLGWAADRAEIAHLARASADELETLAVSPSRAHSASGGLRVRCPHCNAGLALLADAPLEEISCGTCGSTFGLIDKPGKPAPPPVRVGRFLLRERLGVGGFGAVWRARDPELDRDIALKLPRRVGLSSHEAEMFFREARAAAQLTHPGIVSVYEVGRDDAPDGTGAIYLVNELVTGEPLSQWLREGRPDPRLAAAIIADIADALDAAHEQGVIHRDLKPSNVMLDRAGVGGETTRVAPPGFGRPRLMDFGLAKRDAGEATITTDGQVLGTPAYMSPEQASGRVAWVDRRTDVYSLGVVLFRLLTGELPFRGSATSQIQQRQTDDPPPPRRLDPAAPRDLETVCLRCLEREPNRRYATAAEVADEMRRFLRGEPVLARPLSRWGRAARWARRRPASAAALGLAATLAVVGPTAAIVIGTQRAELADRFEEVQRNERLAAAQVDRLTRENSQLRGGLGASVEPSTLPRMKLAKRLVAERGDELAAAAEEGEGMEAALRRLALGRLHAAAGGSDTARVWLGRAIDGLVEADDRDGLVALAAAHEELAEIERERDTGAWRRHAAAALATRRTIARRWPDDPAARVGVIDAVAMERPIGAGARGAKLDDLDLLRRTTGELRVDAESLRETVDAVLGPIR